MSLRSCGDNMRSLGLCVVVCCTFLRPTSSRFNFGLEGKRQATFDRFVNCPGKKAPISLTYSGLSSENNKLLMNCTITSKENIDEDAKALIRLRRCKSRENPDSCEQFHDYEVGNICRFGEMNASPWSTFTNPFVPKLKCPIKKGAYRSVNSTLDVSMFLIFPVNDWYWKIDVEAHTYKRLNVLYEKNWTRLVTEQLKRFERAVMESSKLDGVSNPSTPHWTYGGALLYSLTLLTTVGYGRLSPRTTAGKAAAMLYAIVGVPLMLVLLSALGSLLAAGAKKGYTRLCCRRNNSKKPIPSVGYHRAPSSPSAKHFCHSLNDDNASVQLMPTHCSQNNVNHSLLHFEHNIDHHELPKKAILATVRSSHTRGRCVQGQVRQMLADPPKLCPLSHLHRAPTRTIPGCAISLSDVEETEDNEENDSGPCTHDTPSRVPLIWRSPDQMQRSPTPPPSEPTPSVPAAVVILFFATYVCLGAVAFASTSGWSFLDAAYFCFIALSTIGIGDKLPQNADYSTQLQLLACCVYLFFGLVVVAMCFSLVHEEVATKCKQFAINMGLVKH